jgi:branched-chain amino acid transport system substrate-binding protein
VTNELLTKGGRNVDGIELESVYNPSYDSPAYLQFTEQYLKRFARKPSLAASHSYEAVLVLAEALRKTGGEKAGLPEALVQIKKFTGIQGEFTMDAYGDVQRIIFIVTVNNGQFEVKRDVIP